jgi:hypothetical protein
MSLDRLSFFSSALYVEYIWISFVLENKKGIMESLKSTIESFSVLHWEKIREFRWEIGKGPLSLDWEQNKIDDKGLFDPEQNCQSGQVKVNNEDWATATGLVTKALKK